MIVSRRKMKSKQNKKEDKPQKYGSKDAALAAFQAWQERNADEIARLNNDRLEAGLGKATALKAKDRAKGMKALPAWADLNAMQGIYAEAARKGMQVDHVIPLVGKDKLGKHGQKTVCGLHVPANLVLLTKLENLKKGCRYVPE